MENEVLKLIKKARTKKELDEIIDNKIAYENFFSIKDEVIGVNTDINPRRYIYMGNDNDDDLYDNSYLVWDGYIPLGTKFIYNTWYDYVSEESFNAGGYYYVDDEAYIKEFVYSIKDEEIPDLETLINYIHSFLCLKLENTINKRDRMEIHQAILKNEEEFFKPLKEHSITDLYYNGAGLCSEYSVMGQNILSFLDIKVKLLLTGTHSFQMVDRDGIYYVLDFSKTAGVLDERLRLINKVPFWEKVGPLTEEWFEDFSYGDEKIIVKEYFIQKIGDHFFKMVTNVDRVYKSIMGAERKDNGHEEIIRIVK